MINVEDKKIISKLTEITLGGIMFEPNDCVIVKEGIRSSHVRLSTLFGKIKDVSATKSDTEGRVDVGRWVNDDTQSVRDIPPKTLPTISEFIKREVKHVGIYRTKTRYGVKTTLSLTVAITEKKTATLAIGFMAST